MTMGQEVDLNGKGEGSNDSGAERAEEFAAHEGGGPEASEVYGEMVDAKGEGVVVGERSAMGGEVKKKNRSRSSVRKKQAKDVEVQALHDGSAPEWGGRSISRRENLKETKIRRFKSIEVFDFTPKRINFLIGGNNSGKSSVLQAIHFCASATQSLKISWTGSSFLKALGQEVSEDLNGFDELDSIYGPEEEGEQESEVAEKKGKKKGKKKTPVILPEGASGVRVHQNTVAPDSIIYIPTHDIESLGHKGPIKDDEIEVFMRDSSDCECWFTIKKGRNKNLSFRIFDYHFSDGPGLASSPSLAERLYDTVTPFTVYVPGVSGIAKQEELFGPASIRRLVARGDSNMALRNVLWELYRDEDRSPWEYFLKAMREIFSGFKMTINFDPKKNHLIDVRYSMGRHGDKELSLPLEAAGTSVLQASQILSYIFLFNPRVLILDEPDAHMHANNQRSLMKTIKEISLDRDMQLFISTHSPHFMDAAFTDPAIESEEGDDPDVAVVSMVSGGKVDVSSRRGSDDLLRVLTEIGETSARAVNPSETKLLFMTEDSNFDPIKSLLRANDFPVEEVAFFSYEGCGNSDRARVVAELLRKNNPEIKIAIHRDGDFDPDVASAFKEKFEKEGMMVYVTPGSDVEDCFCNEEHLLAVIGEGSENKFPGWEETVREALKNGVKQAQNDLIEVRIENRNKKKRKGVASSAKEEISKWLESPEYRGKDCLRVLDRELGPVFCCNLKAKTKHLNCEVLQGIRRWAWGS